MTKTNTVLTIPKPYETKLKELPFPKIAPGYVMVKVEIAPICIEHQVYKEHRMEWHSDEEHQGHEGVGTICQTLPGSRFSEGDRVVMFQGDPCGECFVCERQLSPTHCMSIPYELLTDSQSPHVLLEELGGIPAQYVPGGLRVIEEKCGSESGGFGFVQYRILQENMVRKIPDSLPFRYAALGNCSIGCTYTGVEDCNVRKGDWVVVAGVGFIGFGAIINAKYRGANVIVLGRNEFRMQQARAMGADHVVNPEDEDWLEQIHALTGNLKGADHVFEASGYPFYQRKALQAVRRFGNVWLFGFQVESDETYPMHFLDEIHNRGVHLSGNHDVHVKHREGLIKMLEDPQVQRWADHLITHEYNMSEADEAFEAALSKKAGKIFLYPWENCPKSGPTFATVNKDGVRAA